MEANEFFRSMGLDAVKGFIKNGNIRTPETELELKRLVESHELVEHAGGLDSAKKQIELKDSEDNCLWCVDLKIAIADVESCMELANDSC